MIFEKLVSTNAAFGRNQSEVGAPSGDDSPSIKSAAI
jgi:hypothetical protein